MTDQTQLTKEQIGYIIEESNLELNKLYIKFELLKRRISRAEDENTQLKELLLKAGENPLESKQK